MKKIKEFIIGNWQYLILILFSLTPLIWYIGRWGVVINGLDTNFPLDPLLWLNRRFFTWYGISNAGSDFSSSTSGLFFHTIQTIPHLAGFSIQLVQVISLIFWFSAITVSSYIFAKSFIPRSKLAQVVFVALYTFNIYLFNTWENIKVSNLALVVGLPLFMSIYLNFINKRISYLKVFIYSIFASIIASGAGINPAYITALVLGMTILFLISVFFKNEASIKNKFLCLALQIVSLVVINLFWLLPLSNFLFFSGQTANLVDLGFTDWITNLSKDTSIDNVIRLQGAWDWYVVDNGIHIYIPYAEKYVNSIPFIIFSFLIPFLALASLFFKNNKRSFYYLFFAFLCIIGVFLSAGVHKPTGYVYEILLKYLPFFSFFRSPWYIFTPFLLISLSGLVALLLEKLFVNFPKWNRVFYLLTFVFVVSNLVYNYPLVTGKIFRPGRYDSFYVNFPSYVWEAKTWVDKNALGRIATYPDDQLETFSWGYRGTDSILGLISDKEFISPSFNSFNRPISEMISHFYGYLKRGDVESAWSVSKLLGVNTIMVKNDADTNMVSLNQSLFDELFNKHSFGQWNFYTRKDNTVNEKIYSPKSFYSYQANPGVVAQVAPLLKNNPLIVTKNDTEVARATLPSIGSILEIKNDLSDEEKTNESQDYKVFIEKEGIYKIAVEREGLTGIEILVDGVLQDSKITLDSFVVWDKVSMLKGEHIITVKYPENPNLVGNLDFSEYSKKSKLRAESLPSNPVETLLLYNDLEQDVRFSFAIDTFNPFAKYFFKADYKHFYGWAPGIDVIQTRGSDRIRIYPLVLDKEPSDWLTVSTTVSLDQGKDTRLGIMFTIPRSTSESNNKTFVENAQFKRVYDNSMFIVSDGEPINNTPTIKSKRLSPVEYDIEVSNADPAYFLIFAENYNKNWHISSRDIYNSSVHFTANGYANGWYITGKKGTQKLKLYYKPQILFNIGFVISLVIITTSLSILIISVRKKK